MADHITLTAVYVQGKIEELRPVTLRRPHTKFELLAGLSAVMPVFPTPHLTAMFAPMSETGEQMVLESDKDVADAMAKWKDTSELLVESTLDADPTPVYAPPPPVSRAPSANNMDPGLVGPYQEPSAPADRKDDLSKAPEKGKGKGKGPAVAVQTGGGAKSLPLVGLLGSAHEAPGHKHAHPHGHANAHGHAQPHVPTPTDRSTKPPLAAAPKAGGGAGAGTLPNPPPPGPVPSPRPDGRAKAAAAAAAGAKAHVGGAVHAPAPKHVAGAVAPAADPEEDLYAAAPPPRRG